MPMFGYLNQLDGRSRTCFRDRRQAFTPLVGGGLADFLISAGRIMPANLG